MVSLQTEGIAEHTALWSNSVGLLLESVSGTCHSYMYFLFEERSVHTLL